MLTKPVAPEGKGGVLASVDGGFRCWAVPGLVKIDPLSGGPMNADMAGTEPGAVFQVPRPDGDVNSCENRVLRSNMGDLPPVSGPFCQQLFEYARPLLSTLRTGSRCRFCDSLRNANSSGVALPRALWGRCPL